MVASLFGLMLVQPVGQMVRIMLSVFNNFGVSTGKMTDLEIKRQIAQVKIKGMMLTVFLGLCIRVGSKQL